MKVCKNNHNVPSHQDKPHFCPDCGDDLRETPEVQCSNGHLIMPWHKFCETCGIKVNV